VLIGAVFASTEEGETRKRALMDVLATHARLRDLLQRRALN